jgi:hypothetical protein
MAGASVDSGSVADVAGGDGVGGRLATRTNHLSTGEISNTCESRKPLELDPQATLITKLVTIGDNLIIHAGE